jgi:Domain of unknown function (DUF4157)
MSAPHGHEHDRTEESARVPERPRERADDLASLASRIGNAGVAHLARSGEGLLPGGGVHPDVEGLIAQRRGGGSTLDPSLQSRFGEAYGDPLGDVRVHTDATADNLARSVQAKAFTVGSDVFFGAGQYTPESGSGQELIGHELAHVVQQRGASTSGPLTVTEPGDAMETGADQASSAALGG